MKKPFIEGSNVKVPNLDKPFFSYCEGEVVSYNSIRKTYQIKLNNGSTVIYPESHVKGWWQK